MAAHDTPDALALLYVQQYLHEQSYYTGACACVACVAVVHPHQLALLSVFCRACTRVAATHTRSDTTPAHRLLLPLLLHTACTRANAALAALEVASGVKYDDDKPSRGSELLEVCCVCVCVREREMAPASCACARVCRRGQGASCGRRRGTG
jgi:hypothetical protein